MIIIYLITTLFYVLASALLGLVILSLMFKKQTDQWPPLIILMSGFLLGQGVLASTWLFLSLGGLLKNYIVWAVLGLIILLAFLNQPYLINLLRDITKSFNSPFKGLTTIWKLFLSIIILLLVILAIGSIILPPSGDGETFYMVLPKIMAYTGYLRPPHDYFQFARIGLFGEFHFAALMIIASAAAAKFLVWFYALVVIGLLFFIGKSIGLKAKGQIVVLAILLTSSAFTNYISDGKTDIFAAAFGLATYYWLLQVGKKRLIALILTGIFLGFAIVAKLSNAIVMIPGVLVFLTWNNYLEIKNYNLPVLVLCKKLSIDLLIVGFFAFLVFIPTIIKNHVLFTNTSSVYYTSDWSMPISPVAIHSPVPVNLAYSAINTVWIWVKQIFGPFINFPFLVTFWEYPAKGNNMSILALAFLPLLYLRRQSILVQKQIFYMVVLGLGLWIAFRSTVVQPRYILATLLIFIPLIALSVENIFDQDNYLPILKKVILGSIFIILAFSLVVHIYLKFNPGYIEGSHHQAMNFINQKAVVGDRIFLVGSYSYFLRPDLLVDLNMPSNSIAQDKNLSSWENIYNHGFNYVIIQKDDSYSVADFEGKLPLTNLNVEKIYSDALTDIYSMSKK